MEKLILVHYVNAPKSSCERYSDQLPEDDNISHFIIPIIEGESRIECLNPRLVSDEEYQKAKKVLENITNIQKEKLYLYDENKN